MDVLTVLLTLALAACVEVPVALYVTRPKVAADTKRLVAEAEARLNEAVKAAVADAVKPMEATLADLATKAAEAPAVGKMRGDVDPLELIDAKMAKAEARAVAQAENEAAAVAQVAEKLGPEGAGLFWDWLGKVAPDVKATAIKYRAGYKALAPFLARFKSTQPNGVDAAKAERYPLQTE